MDDEPTGAADEDATADDEESAAIDGEPTADVDVISSKGVGQPDPSPIKASDGPIASEVVEEEGDPPAPDDDNATAHHEESSAVEGGPVADADVVSSDGAGQPDPSTVEASDDSVVAEAVEEEGEAPVTDGEQSAADEIIELPWDDDLPVALGEETDTDGPDEAAAAGEGLGEVDDLQRDGGDGDEGRGDAGGDDDADDGTVRPDEYFARRRREAQRGLESWRTRSATGAIASAIAMGLQQVFEPEKRRPAMVAEAPSDPYSDDDPVTVEYVPDDAEATTVRVKPWLLQKGGSE